MVTVRQIKELVGLAHEERSARLVSDPDLMEAVLFAARYGAKGPIVQVVCERCQKHFPVARARRNKARFCTVRCHKAWLVANPDRNPRRMTPDRFFAKVDKRDDGCWIWTGVLSPYGYAIFADKRKSVFGHRYAYQITKGAIPEGTVVRHTCDNRPCVNPDHLIIGTTAQNQRDKAERGRACRGEQMWSAKLTEEQVIEARALYRRGVRVARLSEQFGINHGNMTKLVRGESWKHV